MGYYLFWFILLFIIFARNPGLIVRLNDRFGDGLFFPAVELEFQPRKFACLSRGNDKVGGKGIGRRRDK